MLKKKIHKTTSLLWKLTRNTQQSETCLYLKTWTLGRNSWENVAFFPGTAPIPLFPTVQSLWRFCQGKTIWGPAACCHWWGAHSVWSGKWYHVQNFIKTMEVMISVLHEHKGRGLCYPEVAIRYWPIRGCAQHSETRGSELFKQLLANSERLHACAEKIWRDSAKSKSQDRLKNSLNTKFTPCLHTGQSADRKSPTGWHVFV